MEEFVAPERYELTIFVGGEGSSSYALGIGTSEIINKNHDWIRVRVVEQQGPEGLLTYANQVERRPFLMLSGNQNALGVYSAGLAPLDAPIDPPLVMFNYAPNSSVGVICADPNVKELADLAGLKINLGVPSGGNTGHLVVSLLKSAGIEIDLQTIASSRQGREAYIDGRLDCTTIGIIDQWTTSSAAEVMQTRGAYMVNHGDDESFAKAREESGLPMVPNPVCNTGAFQVPLKLDYNPVTQPKVNYVAYTPGYMAAPDVPKEVVYEMMQVIYENRSEYVNFHVNGKYMENEMANMVIAQDFFHPGAAQFYEDIGIEYGIPGHNAQQAKAKAEGDPKASCI